MFLVGLTGGIGSGKSTVAARFATLGAEVIDADQVAREVVEPGGTVLDDLVTRFGGDILRSDGTLDRGELASRAFATEETRADLDRITHPAIAAEIARRVAMLAAGRRGASRTPLVVIDHPLLLETSQTARFDAVVVVMADEEERIRRVVEQRGLSEPDVRARVRAQVDDATRRAAATYVVDNDAGRDALVERADEVYAQLRDDARAASVP